MSDETTELQSLSKLKIAGRLRYWRGTIEIPETELHAICDEIQAEHDQAIAATLGNERATHGTLTAEQVREAIERNFGKVAVIDDGGEKVEWREGWVCKVGFNSQAIADELNATLGSEINGDTSDGYHTFNELYHHRAVLFSVIVRDHRDIAWKARKHHDGTMYDDMFIVGIETPKGQATYHYDLDPYWEMFDCEERESAQEWDGHTPDEAIARIAELGSGKAKDLILRTFGLAQMMYDCWLDECKAGDNVDISACNAYSYEFDQVVQAMFDIGIDPDGSNYYRSDELGSGTCETEARS